MKIKILLNAPSSIAINYIEMFRSFGNEIELHVITQTNLVKWYESHNIVFKVHDISADFLKNQFDENILKFEIPYELPLWEYVEFDRFLSRRPHEEIISVARHHCRYLNNILCNEKIDFILGEIAGFEHAILCWYGAKKNIPFVWPMMSFWPDKFFIASGGPLAFQNKVKKISSNSQLIIEEVYKYRSDAMAYIEAMTFSTPLMVHVKDHFSKSPDLFLGLYKMSIAFPRKFLGLARHLINPPRMYLDPSPIKSLLIQYIRKINYLVFSSRVLNNEVPSEEKNVLYYLHYEPDLSTLVWSPYFKNQIEVITNIAFSLPNNHRLYVKEHPLSAGSRPIGFYEKIASIPNVRLLSQAVPTKSLLSNTSLVITVTGTIAWEALLFSKPVITLGNIFFNAFKGVVHISDWGRLRDAIANLIVSGPNYSRQDVVEFVSLVMADCASGDYYKTISHPKDTQNSRLVATEIIKFAKLAKESM